MNQASGELFQAIYELNRAVDVEFTGNSYYLLSQKMAELCELVGFHSRSIPVSSTGPRRFATALLQVRKKAEEDFIDNRFYLISNKLDELFFLSGQVFVDRQMDGTLTPNGRRSFDDLAAASLARVEQVAATLSIPLSPARVHNVEIQHETLADGELERRSSEPCFFGDPQLMEEMAAATIFAEAVPQAGLINPAAGVGPSSAQISHPSETGQCLGVSSEKEAPKQTVRPATSANDRASSSAGSAMKADKIQPAPEKSLFTLWLDLLFGRKS